MSMIENSSAPIKTASRKYNGPSTWPAWTDAVSYAITEPPGVDLGSYALASPEPTAPTPESFAWWSGWLHGYEADADSPSADLPEGLRLSWFAGRAEGIAARGKDEGTIDALDVQAREPVTDADVYAPGAWS